MGRIASRALYLVTPLAFATHPALAKADVAASIASTATPEIVVAPARAYIVVTVPAAQRLANSRSLGAVIDDVVKRRLTARPIGAAEEYSATEFDAGPALSDTDRIAVPRALGDDVIATHAERVAFLKGRIDALRSTGADARVLGDLRIRLQRAEAARRLAIARKDVATLATPRRYAACDFGCDPTASIPAAPAIVVRRAIGLRAGAGGKPRRIGPARAPLASTDRAFKISPAPRVVLRSHAAPARTADAKSSKVTGSGRPVLAATHPTDKAAPAATSATQLTQARRSLARARALLADAARHVEPRAELYSAALIHFPGSETWSLADARRRTV